jgi:hypothetical protein
LEKEALLVVNEILAKLNQNEKLIGGGAIVWIVGWLVGFLLASVSYAGFSAGNVFNSSGGTGLGFIGLLGALAAIAVLYLKYAPNQNIKWPAPLSLIMFVIGIVVGVVALYLLYQNWTNSNDWNSVTGFCSLAGTGCPSWPMTAWIAVILIVIGAALMVYASYMEWNAAGRPTANQ